LVKFLIKPQVSPIIAKVEEQSVDKDEGPNDEREQHESKRVNK
jgi:hypothetical protein